jgi:hypothetical protein
MKFRELRHAPELRLTHAVDRAVPEHEREGKQAGRKEEAKHDDGRRTRDDARR